MKRAAEILRLNQIIVSLSCELRQSNAENTELRALLAKIQSEAPAQNTLKALESIGENYVVAPKHSPSISFFVPLDVSKGTKKRVSLGNYAPLSKTPNLRFSKGRNSLGSGAKTTPVGSVVPKCKTSHHDFNTATTKSAFTKKLSICKTPSADMKNIKSAVKRLKSKGPFAIY